MKKKVLLTNLLSIFLISGCGGGSNNGHSNEIDTTLGNKILKTYSIANHFNTINFNREPINFDKYKDINEYANYLSSIKCDSGNINAKVIKEENKCGILFVNYNNCIINNRLIGDGNITLSLNNYLDEGCLVYEINTTSDYSDDENILNKKIKLTAKKGFNVKYSNKDDYWEYTKTANGTILAEGKAYNLINYKLYIYAVTNEFQYFQGKILEGNNTFSFVDSDDKAEIYLSSDNKHYIIADTAIFPFLYNSKYYGINNTKENVNVIDSNNKIISDKYSYDDVYYISF